jgi:hypothetical protein
MLTKQHDRYRLALYQQTWDGIGMEIFGSINKTVKDDLTVTIEAAASSG